MSTHTYPESDSCKTSWPFWPQQESLFLGRHPLAISRTFTMSSKTSTHTIDTHRKAIHQQLHDWASDPEVSKYVLALPDSARTACSRVMTALSPPPEDTEDIRPILNAAKEALAKVSSAAMKESSQGFRYFLSKSLSSGASWAHKFSRTWQQEKPSLAVERDERGEEIMGSWRSRQKGGHSYGEVLQELLNGNFLFGFSNYVMLPVHSRKNSLSLNFRPP